MPTGSQVDVIGVVKEYNDVQHIVAKTTQRQLTKRDLTLVDQSDWSIKVTLWGQLAENFDGQGHPVVAFKGLRPSEYQGEKSVSSTSSTQMAMNPDIPECHALRGWFDSIGRNAQPQSISASAGKQSLAGQQRDDRKLLAQIESEHLGRSDKPDYFSVKATITFFRDKSLWYEACPGQDCNKKVTQDGPNWRCEKCARSYNHCEYRYIMSMSVADSSGSVWLQCFNDVAEQIFGKKAEELHQMQQNASLYNLTLT